jgi:TPR repeat protein
MYANGKGVPQDNKEAAKWYRLAAEQGHADAQYNLGLMYANGKGVPEDANEAVKWFRLAAEQGHDDAQYNLRVMYAEGRGVPECDKEALTETGNPPRDVDIKLYRKAADQGDAEAQYNLGRRYENGDGVLQDYVQSYAWFNLASANGDAEAKQARNNLAKKMTPEQIARAQELSTELHKKINAAK